MFTLFSLFLFGLVFGSFASVLITRLKEKKSGILTGRSACPACGHTLGALELVPLVSYLKNNGKCHYCKAKIPAIYPVLELCTGIVFALIGYCFFPENPSDWGRLVYFLMIGYITVLYIFYDILYKEIHEGIMLSGILAATGAVILSSYIPFLPYFETGVSWLGFGYIGVFLAIYYLIMLRELHEALDIFLLFFLGVLLYFAHLSGNLQLASVNAVLGTYAIFVFFYGQIFLSRGRALGGGDLRIGIVIGLLLGWKLSIIALFLAYFVGSIIGVFILVRDRKKAGASEVAFGPFLGIGFLLVFLFHEELYAILEQHLLFL